MGGQGAVEPYWVSRGNVYHEGGILPARQLELGFLDEETLTPVASAF
jgi:hypothetical protein